MASPPRPPAADRSCDAIRTWTCLCLIRRSCNTKDATLKIPHRIRIEAHIISDSPPGHVRDVLHTLRAILQLHKLLKELVLLWLGLYNVIFGSSEGHFEPRVMQVITCTSLTRSSCKDIGSSATKFPILPRLSTPPGSAMPRYLVAAWATVECLSPLPCKEL